GVETDAAFERAERVVVLAAIAGEDLDASVVHADGTVDGKHALRTRQHSSPGRVEPHRFVNSVEILVSVLPESRALVGSGGNEAVGWTLRCGGVEHHSKC